MRENGKKIESVLKEFRFGPKEPKIKSSEIEDAINNLYHKKLDRVLVLDNETEDGFREKLISELNKNRDNKKPFEDLDAYLYIFQYTDENEKSFLAIRT